MSGVPWTLKGRAPLLVTLACALVLMGAAALSSVPGSVLAYHGAESVLRLGMGLAGAGTVALLVVVLFHQRIRESGALLSALTFLDAIPTLAWVPVLQQAAPSDEATIVMATVIGGALPLTIATVRGISQVDRHLYLSAKLLGASGRALWVVLVQSARPAIVAGLRNCVYQAARTVIGAEILTTADFGLGRLATYARQASSVGGVIVVATIIGSAVALVDTLVLRRLQLETERRWQTGGRRP